MPNITQISDDPTLEKAESCNIPLISRLANRKILINQLVTIGLNFHILFGVLKQALKTCHKLNHHLCTTNTSFLQSGRADVVYIDPSKASVVRQHGVDASYIRHSLFWTIDFGLGTGDISFYA